MNTRHDLISLLFNKISVCQFPPALQVLEAGVFLTFHCVGAEMVGSAIAPPTGTFEPEIIHDYH